MLLPFITLIALGYCGVCSGACTEGQPDGNGVELLGSTYGCKYLRQYFPEDKYVGIFQERKYLCRQPHTDCCETCAKVLSCVDAPINGIYLAESHFNCSYLLKYYPEDKHVGIYENRKFICQQGTTDCCESCEKVLAEKENSSTSSPTTPVVTTTERPQTTENTLPKDTCINNCLWISDGTVGKCSWLLDPTRPEYSSRNIICRNSLAPGCKGTCYDILQGITRTTETSKTSTESLSTKPNSMESTSTNSLTTQSTSGCDDSSIVVDGKTYSCGEMLVQDSPLYNKRQTLCTTDSKVCCATCTLINNGPYVVVSESTAHPTDKPLADTSAVIPDDRTSPQPVPGTSTVNPPNLLVVFESMRLNAKAIQRAEDEQTNAFIHMLDTLMSTFNSNRQPQK